MPLLVPSAYGTHKIYLFGRDISTASILYMTEKNRRMKARSRSANYNEAEETEASIIDYLPKLHELQYAKVMRHDRTSPKSCACAI